MFDNPEQQQPFHQFISEPADPFCGRTCHVHVEPPELPLRLDPEPVRFVMPPLVDFVRIFEPVERERVRSFELVFERKKVHSPYCIPGQYCGCR